jgi:hypothetical protein
MARPVWQLRHHRRLRRARHPCNRRSANAVQWRKPSRAQGVDPNRIQTISYGKERPEIADSNESAWAQNRRGVTVLQ